MIFDFLEHKKVSIIKEIEQRIQECGDFLNDIVEEEIEQLNDESEASRQ